MHTCTCMGVGKSDRALAQPHLPRSRHAVLPRRPSHLSKGRLLAYASSPRRRRGLGPPASSPLDPPPLQTPPPLIGPSCRSLGTGWSAGAPSPASSPPRSPLPPPDTARAPLGTSEWAVGRSGWAGRAGRPVRSRGAALCPPRASRRCCIPGYLLQPSCYTTLGALREMGG